MPLKTYFCTEFCANTLKNNCDQSLKATKIGIFMHTLKSDYFWVLYDHTYEWHAKQNLLKISE